MRGLSEHILRLPRVYDIEDLSRVSRRKIEDRLTQRSENESALTNNDLFADQFAALLSSVPFHLTAALLAICEFFSTFDGS